MVTCDWLCFTWFLRLSLPPQSNKDVLVCSLMRWTMFAPLFVHTVHDAFSLVCLAIALDHSAYSQDPVGSCSLCLAWIGRFEAWENQKSLFLSCKTIGQQEWAGASCENSLETWAPESLDCETVSKIYIASLFHYPEVTGVFETAMVSDHSKVLHCLLAAQPGQCPLWLTVSCQVK